MASSFLTDAQRWRAVAGRDRQAGGAFLYSVRTTGVYCRPDCGARRPLRDNVRFHDSCADAERAGFRACKRCRPNEAGQGHRAAIAVACRVIGAAETSPRLDDLAATAGLSPHHFHRVFKAATGVTPRAYFLAERRRRVQVALTRRSTTTRALYDAGFGSSASFYESARADLGMAVRSYRRGGSGERIRYGLAQCSLGVVLVAASDAGVCAIALGDDGEALVRDLRARFANAELADDRAFRNQVAAVVAMVDDPAKARALPLDVRGTAFQQQVWAALRAIPAGATTTYAAIARQLKRPAAVRAVARAVATNALAVVVPCHRVVRSDGAMAGYRWGVARKRALLDKEGRKRVLLAKEAKKR